MDEGLGLWIDAKNNRIRVYKNTIKALGDPSYIKFGIAGKTKRILVTPASKNERGALLVDYAECYHCKPLFYRLRKYVMPLGDKTYSLTGRLYGDAVVFALPDSDGDYEALDGETR